MKINLPHYKTILLLCFLGVITILNSCGSDDEPSDGQIITADEVPLGIYDVIRMQSKGDCDDDGWEDLNPCQVVKEDDIEFEFCVRGTMEVIPGMIDVDGLVLVSTALGVEFIFPLGSIFEDFDASSISPLSDLIIYSIGNNVYAFEGRDQSGCYGIISAELQ